MIFGCPRCLCGSVEARCVNGLATGHADGTSVEHAGSRSVGHVSGTSAGHADGTLVEHAGGTSVVWHIGDATVYRIGYTVHGAPLLCISETMKNMLTRLTKA